MDRGIPVTLDSIIDMLASAVATKLRADLHGTTGVASVTPRLLTVDQAAIYLGRSKEAVQHLVASGRIPIVRSDRRVFLDVKDLDRWIEASKQPTLV
jgi:excisionase family DNA binding protein